METPPEEHLAAPFQADKKRSVHPHRLSPYVAAAIAMLLLMSAAGCQQPKMGLIGNQKVDRITAFDPNAVTLQGGVGISRGSNAENYAIAINPLGHRGYVSDELSPTIHAVSLESMPPTAQNTFNATHSASLLAAFPGQQALMLVAAGMDGRQGVVSTMTVTGNQIDRIKLGRDTRPAAITLCDDEKTLLVAVDVPHEVRKLTVANDGSLSSTGNSYSLKHGTRAADVLCAPGSGTGVVIIGHAGPSGGSGAQAYAESFDVSSMSRLHTQRLSVDFSPLEERMRHNDWDGVAAELIAAARSLENGRADFFLLCSNTIHKCADRVVEAVSLPLLHIADACGREAVRQGLGKLGLLGTRFVMEDDFLKGYLERHFGLRIMVPGPEDRAEINRIIFGELCLGRFEEGSRQYFRQCIDRLRESGADGAILGCTEIPMLITQEDASLPLIDTTALHAAAAVEEALAG